MNQEARPVFRRTDYKPKPQWTLKRVMKMAKALDTQTTPPETQQQSSVQSNSADQYGGGGAGLMGQVITEEEVLCHNVDGCEDASGRCAVFHRNGDVTAEVRVILHIENEDGSGHRVVSVVRRMRFKAED